jgi:hypothetical protein
MLTGGSAHVLKTRKDGHSKSTFSMKKFWHVSRKKTADVKLVPNRTKKAANTSSASNRKQGMMFCVI